MPNGEGKTLPRISILLKLSHFDILKHFHPDNFPDVFIPKVEFLKLWGRVFRL